MTSIRSNRYGLSLLLILIAISCNSLLIGCKKSTSSAEKATPEPTPQAYEDVILYTSGGHLYTTNLAGDRTTKFKKAGRSNWFPAASPDYSKIAYWSNSSGSYELWTYHLKQNEPTRLTFFNETDIRPDLQNFNVHNAPTWSPEGDVIAFSRQGNIWVVDHSGFNLETLIPNAELFSPAWSPDGKLLAYISDRNQSRNLYLKRIKTGEEWAITTFPSTHHVGGPVWSPDGKKLAFSLSIFEAVDIWTINFDGSNLKRLTKDGSSNAPAWSPDGDKIAFSSGRQDPYHWKIWVMNADGSGQFAISRNGGFSPVWLRIKRDQSTGHLAAYPNVPVAIKPTPLPTEETEEIDEDDTDLEDYNEDYDEEDIEEEQESVKMTPTTEVTAAPTKKPTPLPTATQVAEESVEETDDNEPEADEETETEESDEVDEDEETSTDGENESEMIDEDESDESYEEYEEYADEDEALLAESEEDYADLFGDNLEMFAPELDFYFAKDLIKIESLDVLKDLAAKLDQYPDSPLLVQGKIRGPKWFSLLKTLSRARANSVLRHLIVNEKIRQINVTALGDGDELPDYSELPEDIPILLVIIK